MDLVTICLPIVFLAVGFGLGFLLGKRGKNISSDLFAAIIAFVSAAVKAFADGKISDYERAELIESGQRVFYALKGTIVDVTKKPENRVS